MLIANDPPTLNLDFSDHDLDAERAAAVGRRSISTLILFPGTAASILVSLLRTGPADAAPLIEEMLQKIILANAPVDQEVAATARRMATMAKSIKARLDRG